ncbi:MAG TPA: hypothetical protein VNO33_24045, partial [Kofleriaceae bacterium]|nr:hypothetical protein [Kofleriaceae bacterium]
MPSPSRAACLLLQASCVAVVALVIPGAAALGYDRFSLPKELLVSTFPLAAAALSLLAARPVRVTGAGAALVAFLLVSAASMVPALNQTLAWRAFGVSAGGVAAFLAAQRLAALGHRRGLLVAVGAAAVVGAASVLLEAYGLLELSMAGTAPGGSEGNRNFMAHVLVAVIPLLLVAGIATSGARRAGILAALAVVVMAVALSRSRGAWLAGTAAVATAVVLVLWMKRGAVARLAVALSCCALAVLMAVWLPNHLRWASDDP